MAFVNPKKAGAYVLTTKGASIKNDETNVGQQLLKKMGWTAESGLGKMGTGIMDPIKASSNFGRKGFGKGITESSSGMPQQAAFSEILKSLSKHKTFTNNTLKTKLEDKSKKSRSRLHYGKYVRAKDVSQYSEEYLKVILGSSHDDNSSGLFDEYKSDIVDTKSSKNDFGVKTYSSSSNLHEYFSMKKRLKEGESSESAVKKLKLSPTSSIEERVSFNLSEHSCTQSFVPVKIKNEEIKDELSENSAILVDLKREHTSGDGPSESEADENIEKPTKHLKPEASSDSSNESEDEQKEKPLLCIRSEIFNTSNLHDLSGYPYY